MTTGTWGTHLTDDQLRHLGALWGKSDAGGRPNLLLQHLFDALSVAGLMWDHYLAPTIRDRLDGLSSGQGRQFLCWLAGLHDVGKATPAFQRQDEQLAQRVAAAGLPFGRMRARDSQRWRHDRAGAVSVRLLLDEHWDNRHHVEWIWPLIAGHHGYFYAIGEVSDRSLVRPDVATWHGEHPWADVRQLIVDLVTQAAGYPSVARVEPTSLPSRPDQLMLSGLIVMADWIASSTEHFEGIDDIADVSPAGAADRAEEAWADLGLHGGWGVLPSPPADPIAHRFGVDPRPSQATVLDAARAMSAPGLMIVEAPMGEGKTEAALGAAEVLAARFGAEGVFFGMPTQATADPMIERLAPWLASIDPSAQVALLHGKRQFNEYWRQMRKRRQSATSGGAVALDAYGEPDDLDQFDGGYRPSLPEGICEDASHADGGAVAAAEWLLGRHRGLLAPNVVATFDQGLYSATRTKFVAPRYTGLAGKVVIFDEVHAADEYMTEFLVELLAWLGGGRVPVILLSATLASLQRERLVAAYLGGALGDPDRRPENGVPLRGYPAVTTAWVSGGVAHRQVDTCMASRADVEVQLALLGEPESDAETRLAEELEPLLVDGGCALVIRNTVKRAQAAFRSLRDRYGDDVVLLHSRFTAADRADITRRLLDELGAGRGRPRRRIVVATQIAEQSFDVDADLLVTDLAPVDLMLQRIGRLHRRSGTDRPVRLQAPCVLVTGFRDDGATPWFDPGSEAIYGRHHLLRALALTRGSGGSKRWTVPRDIARLVETAYADAPPVPDAWIEDEATAGAAWEAKVAASREVARQHRLTRDGHRGAPTLEDLSGDGVNVRDIESHINVREGDMGEEIVLIERVSGRYRTLTGMDLGVNGERIRDIDATVVLGGTVRLPGHDGVLNKAARGLGTLPEWVDDPWLGHARILELDEARQAPLGSWRLIYRADEGLVMEHP